MRKLLLLLPLLLFCAARPAHAQNNYYVGGCTGEVSGSSTVNCTPSPAIPAGMAVAVYVRWDAGTGSFTSLTDGGGNSYTTQTTRADVTNGQTTVLLYTCSTTAVTGAVQANLGASQTRVDIAVVGYRNIKDNTCLQNTDGVTGGVGGGTTISITNSGAHPSPPYLQVAFASVAADNGTITFTSADQNTTVERGISQRQSNHQLVIADDIIMTTSGTGITFTSSASVIANTDIASFIPQACSASSAGGGTTTLSCSAEVRPNQLAIASVSWASTTTEAISDTNSLSWSSVGPQSFSTNGNIVVHYAETGANSGVETFTITFSGSTIYPVMYVNVLDNIALSSPLETSAIVASAASTAISTGNITTTGSDFLYVFASNQVVGAVFTNGTGYSFFQGGLTGASGAEYAGVETQPQAAPGTYAGTFTQASSNAYGAAILAFTSTQVATPAFSPPGGTYCGTQSVTISDATSGVALYYTLDGSTPTMGSTVYAGPITVSAGETVKALATAAGLTNSTIGTAVYVISCGATQIGGFLVGP